MKSPMTSENVELVRLQAEHDRLLGEVLAAGLRRNGFQLSEADRRLLEERGWIGVAGHVMTVDDIRVALQGTPQAGVKITAPRAEIMQAARGLARKSRAESAKQSPFGTAGLS